MRFLVDAQLPPGLAAKLREAGHETYHVIDRLAPEATDAQVLAEANLLGAVLVTKDEDFVDFSARGLVRTAVVWIRLGNTTNRALWERVEPLLGDIVSSIQSGEVLVEVN